MTAIIYNFQDLVKNYNENCNYINDIKSKTNSFQRSILRIFTGKVKEYDQAKQEFQETFNKLNSIFLSLVKNNQMFEEILKKYKATSLDGIKKENNAAHLTPFERKALIEQLANEYILVDSLSEALKNIPSLNLKTEKKINALKNNQLELAKLLLPADVFLTKIQILRLKKSLRENQGKEKIIEIDSKSLKNFTIEDLKDLIDDFKEISEDSNNPVFETINHIKGQIEEEISFRSKKERSQEKAPSEVEKKEVKSIEIPAEVKKNTLPAEDLVTTAKPNVEKSAIKLTKAEKQVKRLKKLANIPIKINIKENPKDNSQKINLDLSELKKLTKEELQKLSQNLSDAKNLIKEGDSLWVIIDSMKEQVSNRLLSANAADKFEQLKKEHISKLLPALEHLVDVKKFKWSFFKKLDSEELLKIRTRLDEIQKETNELVNHLSGFEIIKFREMVCSLNNTLEEELIFRYKKYELIVANSVLYSLEGASELTREELKALNKAQSIAQNFVNEITSNLLKPLAVLKDKGALSFQKISHLNKDVFIKKKQEIEHLAKHFKKDFEENFIELIQGNIPWSFQPNLESIQGEYNKALEMFEKSALERNLLTK